jgi:hypothetical protein
MTCLPALLALLVSPTFGASIGLFSTPDCSRCNLTLPAGSSGTIYIAVETTGLGFGVDGAEFKVTGLPAGWMVNTVAPSPPALAFGDPFGSEGTWLWLADTITGSCAQLFTATITATTQVDEVILEVAGTTAPGTCPIVFIHCGSCNTHVCVLGGRLYINSATDCTVAVQPSTWSKVKQLYDVSAQ